MKKLSVISILTSVVLIAVLMTVRAMAQTGLPPDIRIAIALDKTTYQYNEPIKAVITLQNQGGEEITYKGYEDQDFFALLTFTKMNEKGEALYTVIANQFHNTPTVDPPPPTLCTDLSQCEAVEILESEWAVINELPDAHTYYSLNDFGDWQVNLVFPGRTYNSVDEEISGVEYSYLDSVKWEDKHISNTVRFTVSGDGDNDKDNDGYIAIEAGGDDCDDNDPNINPGILSLDVKKVEVEFGKGKVKIAGNVGLTCITQHQIAPEGSVAVLISSAPPVVNDYVIMKDKRRGKKWEFKGKGKSAGIKKFNIVWKKKGAIGRFSIEALFAPGDLNGDLSPAILKLDMTIGDKKASGMFQIDELDWKEIKINKWRYKS